MAHNPLELFDRLNKDEKFLYLDRFFKLSSVGESKSRPVINRGGARRPFTEDQIRQALELYQAGSTFAAVAREVGGADRSWSYILNRIMKEHGGDIESFLSERRANLSRNNKDALLDPVESFITRTERELNL